MLREINLKNLGIGALIGVVVGFMVALAFYFLLLTPVRFDFYLLIGLVIGSSLGSGIAGTCGATRSGLIQFLGSAMGGGLIIGLAIFFGFTRSLAAVDGPFQFDDLFVSWVMGIFFSIP